MKIILFTFEFIKVKYHDRMYSILIKRKYLYHFLGCSRKVSNFLVFNDILLKQQFDLHKFSEDFSWSFQKHFKGRICQSRRNRSSFHGCRHQRRHQYRPYSERIQGQLIGWRHYKGHKGHIDLHNRKKPNWLRNDFDRPSIDQGSSWHWKKNKNSRLFKSTVFSR